MITVRKKAVSTLFLVAALVVLSGVAIGATASYNSNLGAPECSTASPSECVAPSSLLESQNTFDVNEPNYPNTIDSATDGGASGTHGSDESTENITVSSTDGNAIRPGDTVDVTIWSVCWDSSNDVKLVYTSDVAAASWGSVDTFDCPSSGYHRFDTQLTLDNTEGQHAVRGITAATAISSGTTEGTGDWDDNDDLVFNIQEDSGGGGGGDATLWKVIDDFEDNDLSEYSGNTGQFNIVSNPTYEGSYALHAPGGTRTDGIASFEGDGLDNYVQKGEKFRYKFRTTSDPGDSSAADLRVAYGIEDGVNAPENGRSYAVWHDMNGGYIYLMESDGSGSSSFLYPSTALLQNYQPGEWWTVEIEWQQDDTHVLTVYDNNGNEVGSGSATPDDYFGNSGTIGYSADIDSGEDAYIDLVERGASVTACNAPSSGDWVIDQDCVIDDDVTAPGDVFVESNSLVTLTESASLGVGFSNYHLMVRQGSGVLIEQGARVVSRVKSALDVLTDSATNIGETSATLHGELTEMQNTASADVWFEYGQDSFSSSTPSSTLSSTGSFSDTISGLSDDTQYQFRAVAEASDGTTNYGSTLTFITESAVQFVDSFEDNDMSEYSNFMGGSGGFITSSASSSEGGYSVTNDGEMTNARIASHSGDGLDNYVSQGDTFTVDLANPNSDNGKAMVLYGVQNYDGFAEGSYMLVFNWAVGDVELRRYNDWNNAYVLQLQDAISWQDYTAGAYYTAEVHWGTDGTHTVTIYDENGNQVASGSGTDSTWSSGGVGLGMNSVNSGDNIYIDNWRITN